MIAHPPFNRSPVDLSCGIINNLPLHPFSSPMVSGNLALVDKLLKDVRRLRDTGHVDSALLPAHSAVAKARDIADFEPEAESQLVAALDLYGDLLRNGGDPNGAEAAYIEAIEIAERIGSPPEMIGRLKTSLAGIYDFSDREDAALPLYEEAIAILESLDPPKSLSAANLRNNVAMIYKGLHRFEDAEGHYVKALDVFEKEYGQYSEDVTAVYNNLGSLYYSVSMEEEDAKDSAAEYARRACEMMEMAMDIRRKIFSAFDPELGQAYSNLASIFYRLDSPEKTRSNFEARINILERNIATHREDYEITVQNYTDILRDWGDEKRARNIEKRSKKILRRFS